MPKNSCSHILSKFIVVYYGKVNLIHILHHGWNQKFFIKNNHFKCSSFIFDYQYLKSVSYSFYFYWFFLTVTFSNEFDDLWVWTFICLILICEEPRSGRLAYFSPERICNCYCWLPGGTTTWVHFGPLLGSWA